MKIVGKNGMIMISGSVGDPDIKYVGDNQSLLVKISVRVSNEKIEGQWKSEYANVDCWGDVAESAQRLQKGDCIFVCGAESNREYNEKIYTTIKADFFTIMPKFESSIEMPLFAPLPEFLDVEINDELPF